MLDEVVSSWRDKVACSVDLLTMIVCLHAHADLGAVRHHFIIQGRGFIIRCFVHCDKGFPIF